MKSQFWKYKIFTSKRKRNEFRQTQKCLMKFSKTSWCGPFAFCSPIEEKEFRKWIRDHLGVKTEHIECKVSISELANKRALGVLAKQLTDEINRRMGREMSARPGNFIIKWIAPEIKPTIRGIAAI